MLTFISTVSLFTFHYASTLSKTSTDPDPGCHNLHSTMLLLYRSSRRILQAGHIHLHSTMLLLYRIPSSRLTVSPLWFTFHYASTLSEFALFIFILLYFIYIPLCFYFIILPLLPGRQESAIYIPLCFYFIADHPSMPESALHLHSTMLLLYRIWPSYKTVAHSHLHSTMLLLYPGRLLYAGIRKQFTFHYASTLSEFALFIFILLFFIYIPLCFYFIHAASGDNKYSYWFTFHYASTLSVKRKKRLTEEKIYIPLCFYFIVLLLYLWTRHIRIYIPLCFYFIVDTPRVNSRRFFIYIPLCFYFISSINLNRWGIKIFTFHYASTLSQWKSHDSIRWNLIYIPLCFYFITNIVEVILQDAHLHSTMLLLYRLWDIFWERKSLFTFHYASTLSSVNEIIQLVSSLFTFHYASTLSLLSAGYNVWCISFTFHYASTLSDSARICIRRRTPFTFHYASTLSRIGIGIDLVFIYIYIPLCFYFILSPVIVISQYSKFTFHYASTLSWERISIACDRAKFTFHYASTLSQSHRQRWNRKRNLHSTMLLLYLWCTTCRAGYIQYLHSTMLLLYLLVHVDEKYIMQIYIPLCFYFIGIWQRTRTLLDWIYIPLCFYFIGIANPLVLIAIPIYIPLCFYFIDLYWFYAPNRLLIYIPLCFYFIQTMASGQYGTIYLHSTMLLLYPVPLFPFYFLQYGDTFCLPPFCIALLSKIFLLPLYKIWIFLDISSFVYPTVFFPYLRSTIIKSCLFYHHPLPKIP